jgi:holo-[acyl-carrier protein] synthase
MAAVPPFARPWRAPCRRCAAAARAASLSSGLLAAAHASRDARRAEAARPGRHFAMNPLMGPEGRPQGAHAEAPPCRSTSTRWRCCATRGTWASRASPALPRCACRRAPRHHRAPAARRAPHPPARRAGPRRCCCRPGRGRVQHRRQPLPQPDGLRGARESPTGPAAPVHLRARQRRPVHLRPRLGPAADADRLRPLIDEPMPGRAREPVHGRRPRRWLPRAPWVPTAWSSTPSPTPPPTARRRRRRAQLALRRRRARRAGAGLGVNAGHDLNRDNLDRLPARRARRERGLHRPRAGRPTRWNSATAETVRDYQRCIARQGLRRPAHDSVIYGIGTDICDIRRIRATLERRGDRFAEKVLGEQEMPSSTPAAHACRARRALPGHALLGQGGLQQGHRPGHPHAHDLARLRDPQRTPSGKPYVLHGALADWFAARG